MNSKDFSRLGQRRRRSTPIPFALYLLAGIWKRYGPTKVAVLFVERRTNYSRLWPWVELWGVQKNAHKYNGPYPIIAHPPCGPWGMMRHWSKESRIHGEIAMELVHRWGGVVEHPVGSLLFRTHGMGGEVERVNQCDYGFPCKKPTMLYWSKGLLFNEHPSTHTLHW